MILYQLETTFSFQEHESSGTMKTWLCMGT